MAAAVSMPSPEDQELGFLFKPEWVLADKQIFKQDPPAPEAKYSITQQQSLAVRRPATTGS